MNRGAVALIDALGFKGIWNDPTRSTTKVLAALKTIGEAARHDVRDDSLGLVGKDMPDVLRKLVKDPFVKVLQLSDTIVVAAGRQPRQRKPWKKHVAQWAAEGLDPQRVEDAADAWLRYRVCRCVCALQRAAALCETPLLYRGVVAVGSFTIEQNFLIGPAVDEAAELMDLADGPYVWLTPAAAQLKHLIREDPDDHWDRMSTRHRVPFKSGKSLTVTVLDPFALCTPDERQLATQSALRSMNSKRLDVAIKRENAETLYRHFGNRIRHAAVRKKAKVTKVAPRRPSA
jgi:hypothetical protein